MSLRTGLLDVIDAVRGIPGALDLRPYKVTVRVRTWTGTRPGIGADTDVDKAIWVDAGSHKPRVRQLTQREIIASGGAYQDQDLRIGPITPPYTGGAANNTATSIFDPSPGGTPAEIFFKLEGPGMAAGGSWFKRISGDVTRPLHYEFVVRRTGEVPA